MTFKVDFDHLRMLKKIVAAIPKQDATISGGAIRDMLLGKEIKDIDVFYSGKLNKLPSGFTQGKKSDTAPYEGEDFEKEFDDIYFEGCVYPIQMMALKEHPVNYMDKFPCNLSKVAMSRLGDLVITPEFLQDVELEMLTFSDECPSWYKKKIHDKYPEYMCEDVEDDLPF